MPITDVSASEARDRIQEKAESIITVGLIGKGECLLKKTSDLVLICDFG